MRLMKMLNPDLYRENGWDWFYLQAELQKLISLLDELYALPECPSIQEGDNKSLEWDFSDL